ncbi:MAG: oligosaccharide flippase family protein [Phycisphaerales bacterium]|nr:MAG: oligosaccharide flippase family protein [Phycisphaerales bacterium]
MADPVEKSSGESQSAHDVTGRERLVSNVLFSWGAHFVFIVAGFIMPRMIDRRLGQDLLGVWDFAWSLISYFGLVQAGIGSSVNRYVARYRATGDMAGVNRVVSSAFCIVGVAGLVVILLTVGASLLLPYVFGVRLGENVLDAQWVVFFLGTGLGISICFNTFVGVLTGCHRWELHNIVKSGWHAATVVAMIVALLLGQGLKTLALATCAGLVLADITRIILAHRVCAGLRVRPALVKRKTIKKLFVFGGKSLIPSVSNLLLNQTMAVLIVAYLGPAALALYARPRSLIHHIRTLVGKMAMVLTPTASSLQGAGDLAGVQDLLIKSVRYSWYMVLPIVLVLVIYGGALLQFWMGPRYANGVVPAILAVGYLANMVQLPVFNILTGLNAHGRAGLAQLIASLCALGLTLLALGLLKWGLVGVALAVTLPLTIANAGYLPLLVCRRVDLDLKRYVCSVAIRPVIHVLPFAVCLLITRLLFRAEPLRGLLWGGVTGGLVLTFVYWQHVLPERVRSKVLGAIGVGRAKTSRA